MASSVQSTMRCEIVCCLFVLEVQAKQARIHTIHCTFISCSCLQYCTYDTGIYIYIVVWCGVERGQLVVSLSTLLSYIASARVASTWLHFDSSVIQ
jgi:hypothetical protein